MTSTLTKVQLLVFAVVTALAVGYGAVNFFHVGTVFAPTYEVELQFTSAGGIYPRADVDLLGTRVGRVRRIVPGPGTGTTVVVSLDHGTRIPRDLRAAIGSKSAIGEQFVELTPQSAGGQVLRAGDVVPKSRTMAPIEVATLLGDLNGLAASIPTRDLQVTLRELSTGLEGLGPTLGNLIDNTARITRESLRSVDDLTSLIDDARTVLDTQVQVGPQTGTYLRELDGLVRQLRRTDPSFAKLFANGIRSGTALSNVLSDNRAALPVLLDQLVAVTDVGADRVDGLRKTLVVYPWLLEIGATGIRRCGEYDARTGKPIERTCRYDAQGRPIYSAYLGLQLPEIPPRPPYFPCTQGYQGTVKYLPNGVPLLGGAKQKRDSEPNFGAGCTASPTDPRTPNVRGSQNVRPAGAGAGRSAPQWGMALLDPDSGVVAGPEGSFQVAGTRAPAPPTGAAGLAWLLTNPMEGA